MNKKRNFSDQLDMFLKTVDIANHIIATSATIDQVSKTAHLRFCDQVKSLMINADKKFRNLRSLKSLESDFLVFWNESAGEDVERFWKTLGENGIDYKRTDVIKKVLQRKKIKNFEELDLIKDNIVVAEQMGKITEAEALDLGRYVDEFEARKTGVR